MKKRRLLDLLVSARYFSLWLFQMRYLSLWITAKHVWNYHLNCKDKLKGGGVKAMKNNCTMYINLYHEFKTKEGESLKDTYARFNTLIRKCKCSSVGRSNKDNKTMFLKSLGMVTSNHVYMRSTQDLEACLISDLYGSLASQESQVQQVKRSIGGTLALVAEQ
ncbi:LOW QUALITY PROTEIN: hypothetical protein OSB04_025334 [Centaurea solstitialis]|uniref:Uncharacterized protein n=1 Tax=Centaurea solstitialis TaxID=347529 RepID=A0AA38W3X6_9ASTR|nr:LOW QUALITY PROTEIN: hypothetical protein OSB04_025334 [Centaurea solstitialis]